MPLLLHVGAMLGVVFRSRAGGPNRRGLRSRVARRGGVGPPVPCVFRIRLNAGKTPCGESPSPTVSCPQGHLPSSTSGAYHGISSACASPAPGLAIGIKNVSPPWVSCILAMVFECAVCAYAASTFGSKLSVKMLAHIRGHVRWAAYPSKVPLRPGALFSALTSSEAVGCVYGCRSSRAVAKPLLVVCSMLLSKPTA